MGKNIRIGIYDYVGISALAEPSHTESTYHLLIDPIVELARARNVGGTIPAAEEFRVSTKPANSEQGDEKEPIRLQDIIAGLTPIIIRYLNNSGLTEEVEIIRRRLKIPSIGDPDRRSSYRLSQDAGFLALTLETLSHEKEFKFKYFARLSDEEKRGYESNSTVTDFARAYLLRFQMNLRSIKRQQTA